MNEKLLTVSLSPHTAGSFTVPRLMRGVILALMPALAMSVYVFGWNALYLTGVAVASCVTFEAAIQKFLLKKPVSVSDGSAILTGILLAFNVPSNLPWWMLVIGSFVAIGIAKMSFGGLGQNPFNPALVGRVFLIVSFPVAMTTWPKPHVDGITAATPLAIVKEGLKNGETFAMLSKALPSYSDMFVGNIGGCIGEVSVVALLLGFAYMLWKKIISWHIPVTVIGTVALLTGIFWLVNPAQYANPLFHVLTGGLFLGAIFMATDYVTSPMTVKGMVIFGVGIGALTTLIRLFGAYPEGMSFAILIMNGFVPLINKSCKPRRFGEGVKQRGQ